MPAKFKKNKTFITTQHRKEILKAYFNGEKIHFLANKYGYTVNVVTKYLKGRATKIYIDEEGTEWRRCSMCGVYKKRDKYRKHSIVNGKVYLYACCRNCLARNEKNRKIIEKNVKGKESKYLKWTRDSWNRNSWRYNLRRKIMRIIKYTDRHGRIINKKDQK